LSRRRGGIGYKEEIYKLSYDVAIATFIHLQSIKWAGHTEKWLIVISQKDDCHIPKKEKHVSEEEGLWESLELDGA
jgi:hypothetical protein